MPRLTRYRSAICTRHDVGRPVQSQVALWFSNAVLPEPDSGRPLQSDTPQALGVLAKVLRLRTPKPGNKLAPGAARHQNDTLVTRLVANPCGRVLGVTNLERMTVRPPIHKEAAISVFPVVAKHGRSSYSPNTLPATRRPACQRSEVHRLRPISLLAFFALGFPIAFSFADFFRFEVVVAFF